MPVQLPAHLQNRQVRSLTERASEGMGSTLPPHVSIQGNSFTFIDAAGNEFAPMLTFDAVIVDISDRMNKRYYDEKFDPNASTYNPPRCWSANGITPSREIASPIHPTCEGCPANVRGSAVSAISGAAVKACRDEKWIAFIVPQLPTTIFQLVITPGSFKNWKAYTETMRSMGVELSFALTRFSFKPKVNGELLFEKVGWIDEAMLGVVEAANREGKTDALVGRSDPVRQPALAAPVQHQTLPPPNQMAPVQEVIPPNQPTITTMQMLPPESSPAQVAEAFAGLRSMTPPQAPFGAAPAPTPPSAAFQTATAGPAATTASPSEAAPRRRRRSAADAPAVPAAPTFGASPTLAPQAPFGQPAQATPAGAAQAPFGQAAAPAGQTFGIQPGAPVNPEMLAMLEQMGFQRAPQ